MPALLVDDTPSHPLADYFAGWREERAAARVPARERRRAVITMVCNEPVFLPIWLAYYGRWFAPDDLYVLDNDSDDGSTSGSGFVRIPASCAEVDHRWMVDRVAALQHELLDEYDQVLVCDVDELIVPAPRMGTLGDYLDRLDEPFVTCLGYELLHRPQLEPPIDLDRPLLEQRGYWFPNDVYSKPAVTMQPAEWNPGFHTRTDNAMRMDPDLRMVHLHRLDFDLCSERHRTRSRKRWAEQDDDAGWAVHNRLTEGEEFRRWFEESLGVDGFPLHLEEVPAAWRGLF